MTSKNRNLENIASSISITKNGKTLDITNGVGRIHNNARFLADSEIVLYRLDY